MKLFPQLRFEPCWLLQWRSKMLTMCVNVYGSAGISPIYNIYNNNVLMLSKQENAENKASGIVSPL